MNTWLAQFDASFNKPGLFQRAVTHRSYSKENNERLEFLGDAVLDLIIGEALFQHDYGFTEGELSRLRALLVQGKSLAELALEVGLEKHLRLGTGEEKTGGRSRSSILAGAFEAVIGAVYTQLGFEQCEQLVLELFDSRLQNILDNKQQKDAKTSLQEYLQQQGLDVPVYKLEKTSGKQHQQIFYVQCSIKALKQTAKASGSSKKKAEQNAAKAMLLQLKETLS